MGLLDQLWDDTVAGPPPLRKLRKYNSFSPSSSSSSAAAAVGQVSRSITILRTPASSPRSPTSPTSAPDSPVAPPGPRGDWKRLQRKSVPAAEGMQTVESRNPTVYDWFVPLYPFRNINSLHRKP
ncbi:Auxin-repressed [Musa troglodytarum]|uniref:Auxin-repressed n=1 Tax=Musa troglodytarum TaxID=320322 RepID=A0A9E7KPJ8_9LILI|nr:Auxin-repressed [Musa troglodytarum]